MSRLVSSTYNTVGLVRERLKRHIPRGSILFRVLRPFSQLIERTFILYRRHAGDSVFFREHELAMMSLSCPRILDKTIQLFEPRSVLDVGCGVGVSMDYLVERGIEVMGVEGSDLAIKKARNRSNIVKHNLNRELNLGRKFDLVWSYEVVEHIRPKYVDKLTKTFANHGDLIVMSAAPPGQGGEGHFNEQPPSYWVEKFSKHGFELDEASTEILRATGDPFCQNMLVFSRKERASSS